MHVAAKDRVYTSLLPQTTRERQDQSCRSAHHRRCGVHAGGRVKTSMKPMQEMDDSQEDMYNVYIQTQDSHRRSCDGDGLGEHLTLYEY